MHGYYRVATAVPVLKLADPAANAIAVSRMVQDAADAEAALVVFPELCLTGYTVADLFFQPTLQQAALDALDTVRRSTTGHNMVVLVGLPLVHQSRLYNCAAVLQGGEIKGIVPKTYLPTYNEYYEKRWFTSGAECAFTSVPINGREIPFGTDLLFRVNDECVIGVEICEDFWVVVPPSSYQAQAGATLIANLSASVALVAKDEYRQQLIVGQSGRCISGYIYASSGVHESTTDVVYGGHALIGENGSIVASNRPFSREPQLTTADLDCRKLVASRISETSFGDEPVRPFRTIQLAMTPDFKELQRPVDPHPFVPKNETLRSARCEEIFAIQAAGLAKRLEHTGISKVVIGVSGGLDSTLALLVCVEAFKLLDLDPQGIVSITMPGFGTTDRTYQNACDLCQQLGTQLREVDIRKACLQHFSDIGHDPTVHDVTYENVQARERTQVLMDVANREGGLVIGTGDLSEIALGWSTYNGDHMSMYAVNCSVPKTLIRYVIGWVADQRSADVRSLLHDILDTPITPELLPKGKEGELVQKTEDTIGPYELHDFFLYHFKRYGAEPAKILWLAGYAFAERYETATIRKWLRVFIGRFFNNQFKRSCIPDGPKVGTIALSPRGDWRMPSDATSQAWLKQLED